jgi:hypothetical protein
MMLSMLVGLLATASVTPGQTVNLSTPLPVFVAPVPQGTGYYIMQGNRIVSRPFTNANDCSKALAKALASAPGVTNLVCAHRAP